MKALKYLFVGVLALTMSTVALAQNDHKAVIDQLTKIISSDAADKDAQVKAIFKDYKKDPDVMIGIGRAYFNIQDYATAQTYVDMALKRDRTYGEAYILAGDIYVANDNGGAASAQFEQAIYYEPKNPNGYRRYAQVNSKANPAASVAKLEELRAQLPEYPVDLIAADIYDKAGNITEALKYYEKVDKDKMEDYQLVNFALAYFLKGKFDNSLEVSIFGNKKFPRNAALNRITFFDLTNLQKYPEALLAADALFNRSDSTKITSSDYLYYGYAYLGNKEYDNAVTMFEKSIAANDGNEADRIDALKNISEAYKQKGDYPQAISTYETYLAALKTQTALDINALAQLYMAEAADTTNSDMQSKQLYLKADGIYADMVAKFPSVAIFATLQRAHIAFALDPESTDGLAKPHYEKIITLVNEKEEKEANDNARLIEAYRYLGYYYLVIKDDETNGKAYWQKILDLDPDNMQAKQALGIAE